MILFVGSVALNTYFDCGTPRDVDLIAPYDEALQYLLDKGCEQLHPTDEGKKLFGRDSTGLRYEIEIAWEGTTGKALLDLLDESRLVGYDGGYIAPLDVLYTLKMSHRYKRNSPHFLKTRGDILSMRLEDVQIFNEDWYKARMAETYWYEHPDLTRTKEQFFVDQYKYDHDTIHEAVALYGQPAYTMYQREGARGVSCSKDMFFNVVNEDVRIAGVLEEASVLALERSLIPHPGVKTEQEAFDFALMKVCTSITSGWFREYAWEHYGAVRRKFQQREVGLLQLLSDGLEAGIVRESATISA